jgi:ATP-dependent Clp protease ATP-binding subunit ClpA
MPTPYSDATNSLLKIARAIATGSNEITVKTYCLLLALPNRLLNILENKKEPNKLLLQKNEALEASTHRPNGEMEWEMGCQDILDRAEEIAEENDHKYVEPIHVLIGIVRAPRTSASNMLPDSIRDMPREVAVNFFLPLAPPAENHPKRYINVCVTPDACDVLRTAALSVGIGKPFGTHELLRALLTDQNIQKLLEKSGAVLSKLGDDLQRPASENASKISLPKLSI